jgi:ubiquinone/menaquinone biosynthesis C-methylase UbiE
MSTGKAYKGLPMEGLIAKWYTTNTGRDRRRFADAAKTVERSVTAGGHVLEVAPGPGFLAIEIARSGRYRVTGLDISESFVRIATEHARQAGVTVDFRHGNASQMPFADASFDHVVCMAAFKNFSHPIGALDEIHRVLKVGGRASIYDLRRDVSADEIAAEVRNMRLSAFDALLTRWIFRFSLVKRAYTRAAVEQMVAASHFRNCEIATDGVGFELRLAKQSEAHAKTPATVSAA